MSQCSLSTSFSHASVHIIACSQQPTHVSTCANTQDSNVEMPSTSFGDKTDALCTARIGFVYFLAPVSRSVDGGLSERARRPSAHGNAFFFFFFLPHPSRLHIYGVLSLAVQAPNIPSQEITIAPASCSVLEWMRLATRLCAVRPPASGKEEKITLTLLLIPRPQERPARRRCAHWRRIWVMGRVTTPDLMIILRSRLQRRRAPCSWTPRLRGLSTSCLRC